MWKNVEFFWGGVQVSPFLFDRRTTTIGFLSRRFVTQCAGFCATGARPFVVNDVAIITDGIRCESPVPLSYAASDIYDSVEDGVIEHALRFSLFSILQRGVENFCAVFCATGVPDSVPPSICMLGVFPCTRFPIFD